MHVCCGERLTAFLRYAPDVQETTTLARRHAEQAVALDGLDPFVNLAMGRSFWLEGRLENSLGWLERATLLSPNYAQGFTRPPGRGPCLVTAQRGRRKPTEPWR